MTWYLLQLRSVCVCGRKEIKGYFFFFEGKGSSWGMVLSRIISKAVSRFILFICTKELEGGF